MRRPLFAAALLLTAAVWIRLAAGDGGSSPSGENAAGQPESGAVLYVTGQVCRKEEQKIWLQSVTINTSETTFHQTCGLEQKISFEQKLICETTEAAAELPLGSTVAAYGTFAPFSEAVNPGEFDAFRYYRSLSAGGRLKEAEVLSLGGGCWYVREAAWQLRKVLKARLKDILPPEQAGVMCALLLGDRGELEGELKDLYKRNGILHILSISSLHITIIGMGIYRLLRRAGCFPAPAALAGGAVLLFYGMMTGFSVSACRAVGMYLIRMGAELFGRSYDMLTALGILAAAMVLRNPFYLQNSGFLLSFSSVLGIGVLYPALGWADRRPAGEKYYGEATGRVLLRHVTAKLRAAAGASLSITLATLPVQLWYYYETPVYSVAVNLLILPLMKPLLASGFFCLLPGFGFVSRAGRMILGVYEILCRLCERLPFHTWNPGRPAGWQVAAYYGILAGYCLLRLCPGEGRERTESRRTVFRKRKHCRKQAGNAGTVPSPGRAVGSGGRTAAVLAAAVLFLGFRLPHGDRILFLDVGQGDCCLIQTASGENYLFDCGSSSRSAVGRYVLLPCLKYYGIHRLDAVFVSHPDADHINGIEELLRFSAEHRIRLEQLILPAIAPEAREEQFSGLLFAVKGEEASCTEQPEEISQTRGTSPGLCERAGREKTALRVGWLSAGESWDCGAASFTCLHPQAGYPAVNKNEYSLCIYADFNDFSVLLTGDVEGEGERALTDALRKNGIMEATVLKAAHHGSGNSTAEELLDQISPRVAVISCGKNNRYGHPHKEVLERLEAAGCTVVQTAGQGAVTVRSVGGRIEVRRWTSNQ